MIRRQMPYLIAFISGFAMMAYEILGVRVLSPYFGGTIYVWGAIIAVFLTGLGIGYALGGRMADKDVNGTALRNLLPVPAAAIMLFPLYGHRICRLIHSWELDSRLGALLLSINLFLLPCIFIGMLMPVLVRLQAETTGKVGSASGNIYAVSTAGSITGTLFTSFFLIAWLPVSTNIMLTGSLLALCWLAALAYSHLKVVDPAGQLDESRPDQRQH